MIQLLLGLAFFLLTRMMATGVASASAASSLDTILGTSANRWVKLHTADPGAAGTSNAAANTTR